MAVTREDVMNVYNKYIKGKNYIATSFVPRNSVELALTNSVEAEVVETGGTTIVDTNIVEA